jgi:hypothetical protein
MAAHSTLTGADLHECKGTDAAAANTVRVANGSGSATWQKLTADSINTSNIKNVNKQWDTLLMKSPTDPVDTVYFPLEQNKTLATVKVIVNNTVAGNLTVAVKKNGSTVASGTISSTTEGSTSDITVNTAFTTSDTLSLTFSGTTTSSFSILLSYTL